MVLLFVGYAAYYFCRADLSVATPLLVLELQQHGMSADTALIRVGAISSAGILAYALGKFFLGGFSDLWGGKRGFLIGLGGAMGFTLLFAASGALPLFTFAWIGNRLTQSVGWAGLLKVSGRWFDYSSYGMVLGVLSLSYLVGDACARQGMGMLIDAGYGWRSLFCCAAAVVGVCFIANAVWLRESRALLGFSEPVVNPTNLYASHETHALSLRTLVLPLLRSRAFLLVCALSFGCTVVRESFNTWTPMYLQGHLGYTTGSAARFSAIFPAVGAISVLLAGWLSDRMGLHGRALLLTVGLVVTALALMALTGVPASTGATFAPLMLIGLVAFALLGPYSYLGGAFALDFGGRRAGAASSGIIDGVGYFGGVLAGDSVARVSVAFGWQGVFVALAVVAGVSAIAAVCLYRTQRAVSAVASVSL
jgi:OPA family glycerol-3-phosphate transporter-like MFS transporter